MLIHPTVIIEQDTKIDKTVSIDAYSIIRTGAIIEKGNKISSGVEIGPYTKIGKNNLIFKGSYIGAPPQDREYIQGSLDKTMLEIGSNNIIREYVTIHHGSEKKTIVQNNNFFMSYSHIAHDCFVGSFVTLANYVSLGGYATVDDYVFISAHSLIHQHSRVGTLSMIGALCPINQDVPPYSLIASSYGKIVGLNRIGINRNTTFNASEKLNLKKAFKLIFRKKLSLKRIMEELDARKEEFANINEEIEKITTFIKESRRGVIKKWRN